MNGTQSIKALALAHLQASQAGQSFLQEQDKGWDKSPEKRLVCPESWDNEKVPTQSCPANSPIPVTDNHL